MLKQSIAGVPESIVNEKVHPSMRSIREQVIHLTECYLATMAAVNGAEYSWGAYQPGDVTFADLEADRKRLRSEAVDMLLTTGEEEDLRHGLNYIILHDQYHIGQIASTRQVFEPEWSSYVLYGE